MDFHNAKIWSHDIIEQAVIPGAVAVDATMGNGYDTAWLAQLVGETGRVYAFDVQKEAVERTRERLTHANLDSRATLYHAGHEQMAELVKEPVDAVVFNLGWLPGAEHAVTTRVESTLAAVNAASEVLREGGVMTICAYPGHDEGAREREALVKWASELDPVKFDAIFKTYLNQPKNPPCVIAVMKRLTKKR